MELHYQEDLDSNFYLARLESLFGMLVEITGYNQIKLDLNTNWNIESLDFYADQYNLCYLTGMVIDSPKEIYFSQKNGQFEAFLTQGIDQTLIALTKESTPVSLSDYVRVDIPDLGLVLHQDELRVVQRNAYQAALALTMTQRNQDPEVISDYARSLGGENVTTSLDGNIESNNQVKRIRVEVGLGCYRVMVSRSFIDSAAIELLEQYRLLSKYYSSALHLIRPEISLSDLESLAFVEDLEKSREYCEINILYSQVIENYSSIQTYIPNNLSMSWSWTHYNPQACLSNNNSKVLKRDDIIQITFTCQIGDKIIEFGDTLMVIDVVRDQGYKLLSSAAGYDAVVSKSLGVVPD